MSAHQINKALKALLKEAQSRYTPEYKYQTLVGGVIALIGVTEQVDTKGDTNT